jgi:phosphoribosylaminoimidazolecarboxamide formyltransferase/IMP cyclohydrolase
MDMLPIKRALLSVTDKSGLEELARFLSDGGAELVSTGGTRRMLLEAGLPVTAVSDVTGFPEILGGRVKTLHPAIHAGVLADKDEPSHLDTLQQHGLKGFDLLCVNLYNFERALQKDLDLKGLVEEIDIGGPTLLRAGAKNFHSVAVLPDTKFYPQFLEELRNNEFRVSLLFRQQMAAYTFQFISQYDAMISQALSERI